MTQAETWPEDAVEVGRVADAWGVKGWIKVQPFSSDPQGLLASRTWFLRPPEAGPASGPKPSALPALLHITAARRHGDSVVAGAQDVADRNAAEALRGARIFVSRSVFPKAAEDEYYWIDLIGMAVVNREGHALGTVTGLVDTGPHTVLQIEQSEGAPDAVQRMIPFVAAYVDDVSLAERRITVDWGLDF